MDRRPVDRRADRRADGRPADRRRGRAGITAAVLVVLALLLGACSSGGESASSDDSAGSGQDAGSLDALQDAPAAYDESDSGATDRDGLSVQGQPAPGRVEVQTRSVISTGQVQLEVDDLAEARSQIDRLLGRFGGFVAREETQNDDGDTARSTLQLRVPSQHFETMMSSFSDFAKVVSAGRKAEDVTTEVIDVDSRVRTQEISLERLRTFLERATKVGDMIRLESEIARREADLASLRSQQEFLADQTSLATITVRMALPPEKVEKEEDDPLADAGFMTGLRNGWDAMTDVAVVGATAAGALLPFAGVLALILVPLMLWLRTGRRRRQPVSAPPPAAT